VCRLRNEQQEVKKETIIIQTVTKELEHKSIETDEQVSQAKAEVENLNMNIALCKQNITYP
jgi:hypothetical protein